LTPVAAGRYGSTAFWPIPAGTTYWVCNLAGYNSGGGDVKGCEKRVLITDKPDTPFMAFLRLSSELTFEFFEDVV
jgi:hypothetical protein